MRVSSAVFGCVAMRARAMKCVAMCAERVTVKPECAACEMHFARLQNLPFEGPLVDLCVES